MALGVFRGFLRFPKEAVGSNNVVPRYVGNIKEGVISVRSHME